MKEKLLSLLSSIRFWLITLGTLSVLAAHYIPNLQFFFDTVAIWLATVTGIGTLDKMFAKPETPSEPTPEQ
jgi:hypothetical protein